MLKILGRLVRDEEGQGLVEYGLLVALVAVAAIAFLNSFQNDIKSLFDGIGAYIKGIYNTSG